MMKWKVDSFVLERSPRVPSWPSTHRKAGNKESRKTERAPPPTTPRTSLAMTDTAVHVSTKPILKRASPRQRKGDLKVMVVEPTPQQSHQRPSNNSISSQVKSWLFSSSNKRRVSFSNDLLANTGTFQPQVSSIANLHIQPHEPEIYDSGLESDDEDSVLASYCGDLEFNLPSKGSSRTQPTKLAPKRKDLKPKVTDFPGNEYYMESIDDPLMMKSNCMIQTSVSDQPTITVVPPTAPANHAKSWMHLFLFGDGTMSDDEEKTPVSHSKEGSLPATKPISPKIALQPPPSPVNGDADLSSISSSTTLGDPDSDVCTQQLSGLFDHQPASQSSSTNATPQSSVISSPIKYFFFSPAYALTARLQVTEPEVKLAIPSTTPPFILKQPTVERKPVTINSIGKSIYKVAFSPTSPASSHHVSHLRIMNMEFKDDDETTLYAYSPKQFSPSSTFKETSSLKEPATIIENQEHNCLTPPIGSVIHRRQQIYNEALKQISKTDPNACQDPFQQYAAPSSLSATIATWAAVQTLQVATNAVHIISNVSNRAANATGNSGALVQTRNSVYSRAKGLVEWALRGNNTSSVISTVRQNLPGVIDHALATAVGIEHTNQLCETTDSGDQAATCRRSESSLSSILGRFTNKNSDSAVDLISFNQTEFVGAFMDSFRQFYISSELIKARMDPEAQEYLSGFAQMSADIMFGGLCHVPVNDEHVLVFKNTPSFSFGSVAGPVDALYLVGVAESLLEQFRNELFGQKDGFKWLGSGYGAIVATVMALQLGAEGLLKLRVLFEKIEDLGQQQLLGGVGQMSDFLGKELNDLIPYDVLPANHDNLFISVTLIPQMKNDIISVFTTKKALVDTLLATCYIPLVHESPVTITDATTGQESYAISGAVSNRLPLLDAMTVTISPVPGEANISPWLEPTSRKNYNAGAAVFGRGPVPTDDILSFVSATSSLVVEKTPALFAELPHTWNEGRKDASFWTEAMYSSGSMTQTAFKCF